MSEIDFEALVPLGWDERVAALNEAHQSPGVFPGRVTRVERGTCQVTTTNGDILARTPISVAVGDWVNVEPIGDEFAVSAVFERWSQLARRDPENNIQVLAANIDMVFIAAPADRFSVQRVEREMAIAWDSGATPVVVFTKVDLDEKDEFKAIQERLMGAEVIASSTKTEHGLDQLTAMLQPNRTAVLLGPSGAGKSTLANAILRSDVLAIGDVRDDDKRGRHTTTTRQLVVVPSGGVLIDTPGLRSLTLAGDNGGIMAAFPDIDELAQNCRFDDCQHENEPDCAVRAALVSGQLDASRFESFQKLCKEQEYEAGREDPVLQAKATRIWKARTKQYRQTPNKKR